LCAGGSESSEPRQRLTATSHSSTSFLVSVSSILPNPFPRCPNAFFASPAPGPPNFFFGFESRRVPVRGTDHVPRKGRDSVTGGRDTDTRTLEDLQEERRRTWEEGNGIH